MNYKIRNLFTVLASYLFYGWWDYRFLSLIILSSAIDFIIGIWLGKTDKESSRKFLLYTSVFFNLGILAFFKYFNFFIDSFKDLMSVFSININTSTLNIILPVGISFYTFQTLSYSIDVYRKKLEPTNDVISFFAFVSFFPQLVAGPIERASHLLKQFQEKKVFNYYNNIEGLRLILWGFLKKIVIADNFGVLADSVFNSELSISGVSFIVGAIFFALQIYADFSGYSDIAIGLSKMLGYDLMKNFRTPYFATSFSDFWQRWHISLSTWFRDYVYIPLGGNRKGNLRVSLNILITFLLSGLWHGANITFIIWGGLHGFALILEKNVKIKFKKYIYTPFVLILVILFWIPFRAENYSQLSNIVKSIFHFSTYSISELYKIINDFSSVRFLCLVIVTIIFLIVEYNMGIRDFSEWINEKSRIKRLSLYYILIFVILIIGNFSVKPNFIYFQF
jgi:D-alanyl-lipoteichoic acid acyltransferase DltB (MBOAT superfamily)